MKIERIAVMAGFLALVAGAACADRADERADAPAVVQREEAAGDGAAGERGTLAEARAMLASASAHYAEVGREQALRDFTAKRDPFVDRDLYVFCYGPDRTISAHAADADLVGVPVDGLRDVDGNAFGTRIMEVAAENPEGGLVEYKWMNPVTREVESKVSVVRQIGEDVCGVGAYQADGEA